MSRMKNRLPRISTDEVQFYLACGVTLHPHLYLNYLKILEEQAHKKQLCLMPSTILQNYQLKLKKVM